ncbi:rab effector MyRIP [Silurus meridionalis]|nr:rab effector MyRIP [Silurus meridionalis]
MDGEAFCSSTGQAKSSLAMARVTISLAPQIPAQRSDQLLQGEETDERRASKACERALDRAGEAGVRLKPYSKPARSICKPQELGLLLHLSESGASEDDLKHELEEEGTRCLLLAKQRGFNEQCCIRCCGPFSFFLKPRRICLDCRFNVCKACCSYSQHENGYVCAFCHKSRLLRAQSLEWYYKNVKSRFKRFGSAKVLKTLYRKHIIERGALSEFPEVSAPEGSNDNDGSVCGSDSAISKQSEKTLTVALRVAEEAIEEAITKAEGYRDSLIIQRGKQRSEMQAEYDIVWSQTHNSDLHSPTSASSTRDTSQPSTVTESCHKHSWQSLSALSLTSEESPDKTPEEDKVTEAAEPESNLEIYSSFRRESRASILGWKNVDRLDNSSASSVLQSPDGNWFALQTSQHSRPSLLTKRKSLVFSVLEKESGVVSAYDEMGSDSEDGAERDTWGLALLQFRQRLSEETRSSDSQRDTEQYPPITSPSSGHFTNTETLNSDSENSVAPPTRTHIPVQNEPEPCPPYLPYDHYRPAIRPPHSPRLGALDVNFNPQVVVDSSEGEEQAEQIRRLRRRKRNKRETPEQSCVQTALYTGENSTLLLNTMVMKRQDSQEILNPLPPSTFQSTDTVTSPKHVTSTAMTPEFVYQNTVASNFVLPSTAMQNKSENDTMDHELRSKLSELVDQISKEELTSSDDEPMQKVMDRQCYGERKKESDRVRWRERKIGAHKENNGTIDMERNKRKMERLSERWIERQISRECVENEVVRQSHREKDQKKEGNDDLVKQMEKHLDWDRQQKSERQMQVERNWQGGQVETESENETKTENMNLVEIEPLMITRVNGMRMIGDLKESETQQMTIITEQAQEDRLEIKKNVEEEHNVKEHYSTQEMENRGLLQRNNSERASESSAEAHNHSTPSDPEEQQSSTEISDIEARISALRNAGLNVSVSSRFPKLKFLMVHLFLKKKKREGED